MLINSLVFILHFLKNGRPAPFSLNKFMLKQHNLFYKIIYFHIQYLQKYLHEILAISNIIGNDYLLLDFCQSLENLWSNYEVLQ